MDSNYSQVKQQLQLASEQLLRRQNVLATGIGYKSVEGKATSELAIICSVASKKPLSRLSKNDIIPRQIDGVPTDVYPSGIFRTHSSTTGRLRPIPGGCSISHTEVSAGTLGCWVKRGNQLYLISNNHVIANSNEASAGDLILQPGNYDGGINPDDVIAELSDFIPINYQEDSVAASGRMSRWLTGLLNSLYKLSGSSTRLRVYREQKGYNICDCAIARPLNLEEVAQEILQIGKIEGVREAELGMHIKKSGRTTGLTSGTIIQTDVTVKVNYGYNKTAQFSDQLMAGSMSSGGDSGSAVLDTDNNIVGLLFAGSETTTLINRIQNVFEAMDISLPEK